MAVIAVIQQKGGVGKSTITANVAGEFVKKGRAVKILDLDPQQSLVIREYAPSSDGVDEFRQLANAIEKLLKL